MTCLSRRKSLHLHLLALAAGLAGWAVAQASTVIPMSVATLADNAGQVIVGRVAAVRCYRADNPRRIESEVMLEGVEYLKGRLADSSDRFTLIVPGGEVDKLRMTVCCAPDLRIGEKWMLFLLPTYHTFPVVGIFQGAFLIKADKDGVERVISRTHGRETSVAGIGADGFVQYVADAAADARDYLVGADNMRLVTPDAQKAEPIAFADFVTQLAPVLAASRDHQLKAPAGRPEIVELRAVPLQYSRMEKQRQAEKHGAKSPTPPRGEGGAVPMAPQPDAKGEAKSGEVQR
jgi:hypothetical protein